MVQAALAHVFTDKADAAQTVRRAEKVLAQAAAANPHEYTVLYRAALLLIGSGQKLGDAYTKPGIAAGLQALKLYPNSLELITGVASGYLQLDEPQTAEELLRGLWDADPNYVQSGVMYVKALAAQGKIEAAREALGLLKNRFPEDDALIDLESQISTQ
jgi:hypothetical protein